MKKLLYILLLILPVMATAQGVVILGGGSSQQSISLTGNILSISGGGSVDLSGYLDNTDGQTVTDLSLSGDILSITLSGGNTKTVDLSSISGSGTSMTPAQVKDSLLANADTNVLTDAEKAKQVYLSDVDDYIQQQLDSKAGLSHPYFVTPIHIEEPTQDDHAATRLYVKNAVSAANLLGVEAETASKTAELTDANGMVDFTSASDVVYTIPEDASVAFPIGTILMPRRNGAGNVSIAYSGAASGDTPRTYKYGESLSMLKTGANAWVSINSPRIDYRYVQVMLSDLSTTLTTGTKKGMWIAPANGTIESPINNGVAVVLDVAGTSTGINIDINKNGADIATTNLTTDATEPSSDTAATDFALSSYTFTRGDKFIFDIDAVPTGATGAQLILKVYYD